MFLENIASENFVEKFAGNSSVLWKRNSMKMDNSLFDSRMIGISRFATLQWPTAKYICAANTNKKNCPL